MSSTILGGDVTVYWSTDNNQLRWEWTGSATGTRTMNEVYSAWKTLEALSANMSERVGMTAQTPVDYTNVNGYFVDDTTMEHMTGGTLQSSGWAGLVILKKQYNKAGGTGTDFNAADIGLTIVGTTSGYSGTIVDFNTVTATEYVWIRPDDPTVDLFDNDTEAYTVTTGTGAAIFAGAEATGESIWANPNTIATLASFTEVYIYQSRSLTAATAGADDKAEVIATKGTAAWWPTGNIDILLKVQENDVLFDQGFATFFAHQYGNTYSHAIVDLSAGARTPIALETQPDGNNTTGHRQTTGSGGSGTFLVGEEVTDATTKSVVIMSVGGTVGAPILGYRVAGKGLVDLAASDALTGTTSGATCTAGAPIALGPETSPASTITITHTANDFDLNNGNGSLPYSISIDMQATPIQGGYELTKYGTKRGSTGTTTTDGIEGEQYIGNELHLNYSALTGAFVEGEQLWMHDTGNVLVATGIVVADHGAANNGGLQLRNVRTYTSNTITKVGDNIAQGSYTDFATVDTPRAITAVKSAVFGTFAGGTFFGAPGVWMLDFFAGDEQAFQLTDDLGDTQSPPNTVSITVTNLVSGDTVAVFRRVSATAGSEIDRAEYNPNGTQGPATATTTGITTLTVSGTISNEAPDAGWVQVVDVSNNNETIRYRYSSVTRASGIFNFTGSTGTADATSTVTQLYDAAADFVTDGVEIGDIVRNTSDGEEAIVVSVDDLNTLQTIGATSTWDAKVYEVNYLARSYVTGDDVWVPFLLLTADTSPEFNSIIHTVDIPVRVVIRNPGTIEPFSTDATIESTGMSQAAIRNPDNIFV